MMSKRAPFQPHRYAEYVKASGRYTTDGVILWQWANTHWEPFEERRGKTHAYRWLVKYDPKHVSDAYAGQAYAAAVRWLEPLARPDVGSVILPLKNGYLHVRDGRCVLGPHDKSLGLRHVLRCEYRPDDPEPTQFMGFLKRILPHTGIRHRVQEYVGYTLLPDARFQKGQFWTGSGANGKGTLANIIQALHQHTAAVRLDALDGFRLAGLVGASLIYCDEAPQRGVNEQVLKSLVAGESVLIDRKYRDPLTERICGKWLVLGNHFPSVSDQSIGFWRRWDFVPFNEVIPEEERQPMLAEKIIECELAGVLNWAIAGLLRLMERGAFDPKLPEPMASMLHQAKTETDSVHAWYENSDCAVGHRAETPKAEVYRHYAEWCRSNGMMPVSSIKFWKRLPGAIGDAPLLEARARITGRGQPRCCNIQVPLALGG